MSAQRFGGPWSLIKIETVAQYLQAFSVALKKQNFTRIYIDAFAGSGSFTFDREDSPNTNAEFLFDREVAARHHTGSARRALEIEPRFDRFIFIESDRQNLTALRSGIGHRPDVDIDFVQADANFKVRALCKEINWSTTRGVIFLDPFGNSVEWTTVEALASTKLDVWYLFPLSGIYRNAPLDPLALTPDKEATLTRILGTDKWRTQFYAPRAEIGNDLFSTPPVERRTFDVDDIQNFVLSRLREVFPLVLPPLTLRGPKGAPMFSLFFAMANDSTIAQGIATRIAKHILRGW